ncbi:Fur-regulated protein [Kluyvera sp. CRP]|uniref:Fur-regulated protein n=1 Tax=Kluyvera sp. CRP TaxID=2873269 RepID=UPI001CC1D791|nr:Fur-regulated protein [Kluyvera sp. CRP]UAK19642.1 Fur-regulated protein [Kluyvera sp. CRP]
MSNKIITLSGAATDVLYALFYRGALVSGDLPSKSGAAELRELGFAETRHTATEYQKENHFTFLTAEGQKFAVEHLVDTRFGRQQYCSSISLGVEIDTSATQKALEELDELVRKSDAFKILGNDLAFINDITIFSGAIHTAEIETPQPVTNIYNISLGIRGNDPVQNKVTIGADKFEVKSGVDSNIDGILKNALKNVATVAARQAEATEKTMVELSEVVRKAIHKECLPGGLIWHQRCR